MHMDKKCRQICRLCTFVSGKQPAYCISLMPSISDFLRYVAKDISGIL